MISISHWGMHPVEGYDWGLFLHVGATPETVHLIFLDYA
jgi:hypothetical protein